MWPLEKYACWDGNCWHQVDSNGNQLRLLIELLKKSGKHLSLRLLWLGYTMLSWTTAHHCALHILNMQLLVVQQGTVFESVGLASGSGQLRGVWKDAILVIVIKHKTTSRRFRVKFAATDFNSALSNCRDCVTILSQYVPIHDPTESSTTEHITVSDWYNNFMKAESSNGNTLVGCLAPEPLPPEFPLDKTVQLCILDPSFLELVSKVDAALQQMHL